MLVLHERKAASLIRCIGNPTPAQIVMAYPCCSEIEGSCLMTPSLLSAWPNPAFKQVSAAFGCQGFVGDIEHIHSDGMLSAVKPTCGRPLFLARALTLEGLAFSMRPYSSQCSLSSAQAYPCIRNVNVNKIGLHSGSPMMHLLIVQHLGHWLMHFCVTSPCVGVRCQ